MLRGVYKGFIDEVRDIFIKIIIKDRVATLETILDFIRRSKSLEFEITKQQIEETVRVLALDDKVMEIKSNGMGEFDSILAGTACEMHKQGSTQSQGQWLPLHVEFVLDLLTVLLMSFSLLMQYSKSGAMAMVQISFVVGLMFLKIFLYLFMHKLTLILKYFHSRLIVKLPNNVIMYL